MRRVILATAALVAVIAGSDIAPASGHRLASSATLKATLNISQEIPTPSHASPAASGRFSATLAGKTLQWTLTFAHLNGSAAAAYLHYGDRSQTGMVLAVICTPCKSPASGTVKLSAAAVRDLTAGKAYINVDTFKDPRGEIRGQVS